MFPEKRSFSRARLLCAILNGSLATPGDDASNARVYAAALPDFAACNRRHLEFVWLGVADEEEEGVWRRVGKGEEVASDTRKNGKR